MWSYFIKTSVKISFSAMTVVLGVVDSVLCLIYTWLCSSLVDSCAEKLFNFVIPCLFLGNWSFQAGRRFLLHEGGGPSPWLWLGIFRELGWCCHACHPLVGELCKYHKHEQKQWVLRHSQHHNTCCLWTQLLQQWNTSCIH